MWLKAVVAAYIFIPVVISQDVGEICNENNPEQKGTCTEVTNCQPAIHNCHLTSATKKDEFQSKAGPVVRIFEDTDFSVNIVIDVHDSPQTWRQLRKRRYHDFDRCGFNGLEEIICCPFITDKFGENTKGGDNNSKIKEQRIADRECEKIKTERIPPLDLHILGGEAASIGEYPHMVGLGFDRGSGYEFDCGGSVLSRTYVLTAAHCVDTLDRIAPSIVRGGVVEIGNGTWNSNTDVRIAQIILHPQYTRREKYHDLALLRLETPLQFSSNLNAICLETSDEDPNIPLTITGWGKISNTRNIKSVMLLKANVTAVPRSRCTESYTNWRKLPNGISADQICAGDPKGVMDTCQGDSGGPLVRTSDEGVNWLVGVTSFGRGCGSPEPAVYARVSRYLDWIEGVVWPN